MGLWPTRGDENQRRPRVRARHGVPLRWSPGVSFGARFLATLYRKSRHSREGGNPFCSGSEGRGAAPGPGLDGPAPASGFKVTVTGFFKVKLSLVSDGIFT